MSRANYGRRVILVIVLTGCGGAVEDVGMVEQPLGNGTLDTRNDVISNAVVRWRGCTATLIASRYILTAGHCADMRSPDVGATDITERTWYYHVPGVVARTGMVSGRKRPDGTITYENGYDRPGADYRSFSTSSPTTCRNQCLAEERCKAFTHVASWGTCFLKSPDVWSTVTFGPDGSNPYKTRTLALAKPGFDDFYLVRLYEPVPANVARPMPVLTEVPGNEDPETYFDGVPLEMVGYGRYFDSSGAQQFDGLRRRGWGQFGTMPFNAQPNMFNVIGNDCETVLGGDSGSPIIWYHGGKRFVIGVAQGTQSCGGRYVAAFGPGGYDSDGNLKQPIGSWLESQLDYDRVEWEQQWIPSGGTFTKIAACEDGRLLGLSTVDSLYEFSPVGAGRSSAERPLIWAVLRTSTAPTTTRSISAAAIERSATRAVGAGTRSPPPCRRAPRSASPASSAIPGPSIAAFHQGLLIQGTAPTR